MKISRREMIRLAIFSAASSLLAACSRAVEQIAGVRTPTVAPTKVAVPVAIDNVPLTRCSSTK